MCGSVRGEGFVAAWASLQHVVVSYAAVAGQARSIVWSVNVGRAVIAACGGDRGVVFIPSGLR